MNRHVTDAMSWSLKVPIRGEEASTLMGLFHRRITSLSTIITSVGIVF